MSYQMNATEARNIAEMILSEVEALCAAVSRIASPVAYGSVKSYHQIATYRVAHGTSDVREAQRLYRGVTENIAIYLDTETINRVVLSAETRLGSHVTPIRPRR